jgi:hypothetical protein
MSAREIKETGFMRHNMLYWTLDSVI